VRSCDVVARLGGDEFAVAYMSDDLPEAAEQLGKRIIDSLSEPYALAGHTVTVGTSIGIAIATDCQADADTLLKNADMALYQAKAQGRGLLSLFEPDMERTAIALSYFQRANEDDNIEIINQPALDVLPVFPQRNMDIVFVDAQRSQYAAFMQHCFPLLKLSGLLIFNNLLRDDRTLEFTREFLHHPGLDATILPIGSGLGIGARKR